MIIYLGYGIQLLILTYKDYLEELIINNLNVSFNISFKFNKLKFVNLSNCLLLSDKDVWLLCKNNPFIKHLNLSHCKLLTNEGIRAALHMLESIESLDLEGIKEGGCSFFTDYSDLNMISSINFRDIKK